MKTLSTFRLAGLGIATAGAMLATQTVSAKEFAGGEISGSAAVSNLYLFRGVDQGYGAGIGAVSGDLVYSHESGAYAGAWATSGFSGGQELDVFLGYGIELDGGLSIDLNVTSYVYAGDDYGFGNSSGAADQVGDLSELILTVAYSTDDYSVSFQYADNVADGASDLLNGYTYTAISFGYGDISATFGTQDLNEADGQTYDDDISHLDLSYSYNENLSFTFSKIVSVDDENNVNKMDSIPGQTFPVDDDMLFVVTYSLPIE